MGGRGASSGVSKGGAITEGERDIKIKAAGVSFQNLPQNFRDNINTNLKMSDEMKDDIRNGRRHKIQDVWTAGISGVKEKRRVITDVVNGKVVYSVKNKNTFVRRNVTKEQAANEIARFYLEYLKKGRR